ncbi:MAG: thioredoxin family protein [bacterium]
MENLTHYLPYVLGVLVILITTMQLYPYWKLRVSKGKTPVLPGHWLSPDQRRQETLLLYFMAPQCGMCRSITPIVDTLAKKHPNIIKINAVDNPDMARVFSVMGTPAFIRLHHGTVEQVKLGGLSQTKILKMLE